MTYQEFTFPDDQEVLETFGEWPEIIDQQIRQITLHDAVNGNLILSYDPLGGSIRLRWTDASGRTLLSMFREGATRLRISKRSEGASFVADFDMGECRGEITIHVTPAFEVGDQLLFT